MSQWPLGKSFLNCALPASRFDGLLSLERSEDLRMNRNARRARAIAIAQAKPDTKLAASRFLMLATGATAALVTLLIVQGF
ncbi:hypothetical protein IE4872_CH00802 [Rhizobium gallicum]|uniref:Uncharacterized protein n=1 Tax=Rhizobium gallicum TaxID=56730 RepID=A0A1L5NF20_9HYPH|nr:hypothetical protein IE4872_CH00802 [Rhizobium gallicum]